MGDKQNVDEAVERAFGSGFTKTQNTARSPGQKSNDEPPDDARREKKETQKTRVAGGTVTQEMCGICQEEINKTQCILQRQPCGHTFHFACVEPLVAGGRAWCTLCPEAGENTVDSGNDVSVRAMLQILQARRREKVRFRAAQSKAGAWRGRLQDGTHFPMFPHTHLAPLRF